jgi:hypothetical protein
MPEAAHRHHIAPKAAKTSTERARRARHRQRAGLKRIAVDVLIKDLAMLTELGLGAGHDLHDRDALGKVVSSILKHGIAAIASGEWQFRKLPSAG